MKFGAIVNIRAAGVQRVNGEDMGLMIADIGPDEDTAKKAVEYLRGIGVSVKEECLQEEEEDAE